MAKTLQWVNYPEADGTIGSINVKRSKLSDGDVASVKVMGPKIYVRVKFKKKDGSLQATLTMTPDGNNAPYSATERSKGGGIYAPGLTSTTTVGSEGVAKFPVHLSPAGGDVFKFKAKSAKGTEITCPDDFETRRKLFYQVIPMRKAATMSGAMLGRFERQFWKPDKKLYIKLEQRSPGKTIANMVNFDDTVPAVQTKVKAGARKAYDKSKAPFSVAVIIVNKNCIPGLETASVPATFNGGTYTLALRQPLFYYADPRVAWFQSMTFTPAGGAPVAIAAGLVTPAGQHALHVKTSTLPHGAGTLTYSVKIVEIEGMGLSLPTENLVTVASRYLDGKRVSPATMAAILTHEIGHKIGMVPGPQGDRDLDQQSTYYDGNGHYGPHCHYGTSAAPPYNVFLNPAPTCTMFGDIRTNTTQFCPSCQKSVRKLDVSPSRKTGLSTQF